MAYELLKSAPMESKFNVVLVNTKYSTNIGSSARALANMGGGRLILLDPKTSLNSKAKQGAAGAQDQLKNRKIYDSWEEFLKNEPFGPMIALSKRRGQSRPSMPLKELLQNSIGHNDESRQSPIFFVFGPEDNGLSSEDISHCHQTAYLPEYGEFNSFNLSQAVLLTLFIANETLLNTSSTDSSSLPTNFPDKALKEWLKTLGFDLSSPKINAFNTIKSMIQRSIPTEKELSNFESAIQQTIRKLK